MVERMNGPDVPGVVITPDELAAQVRPPMPDTTRESVIRAKVEIEFVVPAGHLPLDDLERQVMTRLDIAMTEGIFEASNFLKRQGLEGVMIIKDAARKV